jgi:hypothetical protein
MGKDSKKIPHMFAGKTKAPAPPSQFTGRYAALNKPPDKPNSNSIAGMFANAKNI